jgi:phycocyanin beta chain
MFDLLSRTVSQANQSGNFLSEEQYSTLINFIHTGHQRIKIVEQITQRATEIISQTARSLFAEQPELIAPGGNAYTHRRMAACLRDLEIILRYTTYSIFIGDSSILEERCLNGLRETYISLGTPLTSFVRATEIMKDFVLSIARVSSESNNAIVDEVSSYFHLIAISLTSNIIVEDTMTNSYLENARRSYANYVARLSQKRIATPEDIAMYRHLSDGTIAIQSGDRFFRLEKGNEYDRLDSDEKRRAKANPPYWNTSTNSPENSGCADIVDRRSYQTSVKDQDDRGTCVAHAALANLEAILKGQNGLEIDLSEQYAHWLFMKFQGLDQCDDGITATHAARYLSQKGVCEERYCPYENRETVETHCTSEPSQQAQQNAKYGIGGYALIDRIGFFGPSIANPDYLEAILCHGYDIVFGIYVQWGNPDNNGIYDVLLDEYGNPQASDINSGHAMLMVGYNRSATLPYFICKNSWGTGEGINGYFYLSYDYIRTYAKYGYITQKIRLDMPFN